MTKPDDVFVRINGETHYLRRAVDHEGEVLEVYASAILVLIGSTNETEPLVTAGNRVRTRVSRK